MRSVFAGICFLLAAGCTLDGRQEVKLDDGSTVVAASVCNLQRGTGEALGQDLIITAIARPRTHGLGIWDNNCPRKQLIVYVQQPVSQIPGHSDLIDFLEQNGDPRIHLGAQADFYGKLIRARGRDGRIFTALELDRIENIASAQFIPFQANEEELQTAIDDGATALDAPAGK